MRNQSMYLGQAARRQGPSEKAQPPAFKPREKGLWTFLTWSFFLSQAIAADQAMAAAAANAAQEEAEASSTVEMSSNEGSRSAPAALEPIEVAQVSDGASRGTQVVAAPEIAPLHVVPPEPVEIADTQDVASAPLALRAAAVGSSTLPVFEDRDAAAPGLADNPPLGGTNPPTVDPILPPGIGGIISPIGGIVDDVVGGVVTPIVDTVGDVVGDVVGVVGGVVGGVAGVLDPILGQVVSPVLGAVDNLLGDLLDTVGPDALNAALADIGFEVNETIGGLLDLTNETLQNPLGAITSPVTTVTNVVDTAGDALGGALAPVTGVVTNLVGSLGLSSGGSLQFTASAADLPHYEIMSGGIYTEYGVGLQTGSTTTIQSTSSLVGTATDLVGAILDTADDAAPSVPGSLLPLANTLEDTRDGLGL